MGYETKSNPKRKRSYEAQAQLAQKHFAETQQKALRYGKHLPPNRYLMDQLRDRNFGAM